MRPVLNVLAVVALAAALAFAWFASRRDPTPPTSTVAVLTPGAPLAADAPPPFEPYANAKVGDWRAYDYTTRSSLGNFSSHVIGRITAATADTATVTLTGRLDQTGEQRTE